VTQTVPVAVAGKPYDVLIGPRLIARAGDLIRPLLKRPRLVVVMDETVSGLHGAALKASLDAAGVAFHPVVIAPGEAAKSFAGLEALCEALLGLELDRGDLIAAFGGGVVGDLAGFAAAILKRGIDFVQLPTTLLAQVDSSVGGKTAIDTARGKNLIGAFHQPRLVLADLDVLASLPRRELVCGYAEVIKYGLLGDLAFFEWLEVNGAAVLALDDAALAELSGHPFSAGRLVAHMAQDKKAEGGALTFILARRLGEAFVARGVDAAAAHDFLIGEGAVP
jgi:3-dehydroquinate synthetase